MIVTPVVAAVPAPVAIPQTSVSGFRRGSIITGAEVAESHALGAPASITLGATSSTVALAQSVPAAPASAGTPPTGIADSIADLEVRVVDLDQTVRATVSSKDNPVDLDRWSKRLNGAGTLKFAVPFDHPRLAAIKTKGREVQLRYNGGTLFSGPIVRPTRGSRRGVYDVQAREFPHYFTRRTVGEAVLTNFLTDGDMETDPVTNWPGNVTADVETTFVYEGSQSLRLANTETCADAFRYQQVTVTTGEAGAALFLFGRAFILSGFFAGAAYNNRGLFIERISAGNVSEDHRYAELNVATPKDQWVPLDTVIHVPPNTTETIEVRLYAPGGVTYWDAVRLFVMESVSFGLPGAPGTEQAEIWREVVRYAQGLGAFTPPFIANTKSDLKIATGGINTGTVRNRTYQYFDRQPIFEGGDGRGVLDEFLQMDNGFDFEIVYFDNGRAMVVVAEAGDDIGPLAYGADFHDWETNEDYEKAATDVTIQGEGNGVGRETAGAADTAALGGVTWEHVEAAPDGAPFDALDQIAPRRLAELKSAAQEVRFWFPFDRVRDIDVGDRFTPTETGDDDVDGVEMRVMEMTCTFGDRPELEVLAYPNANRYFRRLSAQSIVDQQQRRIAALERKVDEARRDQPDDITFSIDEQIETGESVRFPVDIAQYVTAARIRATTPSSGGDAVFQIIVDGAVAATATLPEGSEDTEACVGFVVRPGQYVAVNPVALGTDTAGVTIRLSTSVG